MIYIISGTSSGIGKAITEYYLEQNIPVIGISRKNNIKHPKFKFIAFDLADFKELEKLNLKEIISEKDLPIRLINNAGMIGEINRSSELSLAHYSQVAFLNLVAPQYLSSLVLKTFGYQNVDMIVNISSGAAQRPISSWSAYCASKAGLNMFGETLFEEIQELGHKTKVYNVAPGVVDTKMQEEIRESKSEHFSQHERFVNLKSKNQLRTPEEVADLLGVFIKNPPQKAEGVTFRL